MRADLYEMARLLTALNLQYRRAYDYAYSAGGIPDAESVPGRKQSGNSDSTGDVAINGAKLSARSSIRKAGRMVDKSISLLRAATDAVEAEAWPRETDGYRPVEVFSPSLLTRAELATSREAKDRRDTRGDA